MDEGLVKLAAQVRERHYVPGLALGVGQAGERSSRCFGVTNVEEPQPVGPDTLFQLGSVTKSFTCAAIMRLVEAGVLELEAPVHRYLPEFALAQAGVAAALTLESLLSHMGGFEADLYVDTGDAQGALADALLRTRELRQLTPPHTLWSYGNAGFYALGRVIEVTTGKPFEAALDELVIGPLGLRHTMCNDRALKGPHCVGHLTSRGHTQVLRPTQLPRASHSVLGLCASVTDLLTWLDAHSRPGFLSAATLERLFTSGGKDTGRLGCEGAITWMSTRIAGEQVIYQGGVALGQQTRMLMIPGRQRYMVVLGNSMRAAFAATELMDAWLHQQLGEGFSRPAPMPFSPADLSAYAGTYSRRGAHLRVWVEDDQLMIQSTLRQGFPNETLPAMAPSRAQAYVPYAPDRMIVPRGPWAGERVEFYRDEAAGEPMLARFAMRLHRRDFS